MTTRRAPSTDRRRVLLAIHGRHFPGRSWHVDGKPCHNVHVGVQVGREPFELVPGDSDAHVWRVGIEVFARDGGVDFRGSAVHGRPSDRFVYLTWGNVDEAGAFTMFRRAKLMLADLELLLDGSPDRWIVASVDLTDERGGPRCARLRPPALTLGMGDPV